MAALDDLILWLRKGGEVAVSETLIIILLSYYSSEGLWELFWLEYAQ